MKNYRTSDFDQLPSKQVNKSTFDLSHEIKTQMCFGRYYPIHWEECYPGDEFFLDWEMMARYPGLYLPISQLLTYRCDVFYMPYTSMWRGDTAATQNSNQQGWKDFIMGVESTTIPQVDLNINGSKPSAFEVFYPGCSYPIENYMGFPFDLTGRLDADKQWSVLGNAFPLAMYLACYDQAYRNPQWEDVHFFILKGTSTDQDNFDGVTQTIDGLEYLNWAPKAVGALGDVFIEHPAFFAHYMKDYFTASRPQPQEGDALKIPNPDFPVDTTLVKTTDGSPAGSYGLASVGGELKDDTGSVELFIEQETADIVKLRKNLILQAYHELVARIGTRYSDWIKGIHGNTPEPGLIDVPALVGSWFGRIQVTDTITTAETTEAITGNYRGNLNSYDQGGQHKYFCQDYGIMMWIINVMPNTGYSQGIHRKWTRQIAEDYPLSQLSGIGDQEIKRKELLALNIKAIWDDTAEPYNDTISYIDRYAEAKTAINRYFSTNEMYDSWYMGQKLTGVEEDYDSITAGQLIVGASYPTSNGIREVDVFSSLPIKQGNSTYIDATMFCHFWLGIKVQRCLPFFSTPGKMVY